MRGLVLVCVGGAFGSLVRHLVGVAAKAWVGQDFPFATLAVNLVGSFLIGVVQVLAAEHVLSKDGLLLLGTGVMGGLTTYSMFSYETVLLAERDVWRAALNVLLTTAGCLALCVAGMAVGRALTR